MAYFNPPSLEDALDLAATPGRRIIAGGTDFYPAQGDRPLRDDVIDIAGLEELRGISEDGEHVRIGAAATWTDLIRTPLPACFDGLKLAAREVGGIQIQNAATVVGNLCNASPAADGVPPLLTLDAEVELRSTSGRRRLPLGDFITGNRATALGDGEIVTAVLVPKAADTALSDFLKLGARSYLVISIVMVATLIVPAGDGTVAEARVAVGACSPVAQRLPGLEAGLAGAPLDASLGTRVTPDHLAPLSPIDDVRATAAYRLDAAGTLIARTLRRCAGGAA